MRCCLELASRARATGDVAVGSLVVRDGEVIGEGVEAVRARVDVTAHAEIEAIRAAAARLGGRDLSGCALYTTVEPCVMCAYAIRLARITLVVSGARSAESSRDWNGWRLLADSEILPDRGCPSVVRDVLAGECQALLSSVI